MKTGIPTWMGAIPSLFIAWAEAGTRFRLKCHVWIQAQIPCVVTQPPPQSWHRLFSLPCAHPCPSPGVSIGIWAGKSHPKLLRLGYSHLPQQDPSYSCIPPIFREEHPQQPHCSDEVPSLQPAKSRDWDATFIHPIHHQIQGIPTESALHPQLRSQIPTWFCCT